MQLAGLSYLSAPQVTGHPLGLPGAPVKKPSIPEVQPILDSRRPETQLGSGSPRTFYYAVQGEVDPVKHNPPPSIMQIKISQMLQDQALGTGSDEKVPAPEKVANTDGSARAATITAEEDGDAMTPADETSPALEEIKAEAASKPATPTRAEPVPERAPMSMPIKAETPKEQAPASVANAPAAYEEAASISRKDLLSVQN
ncbi:hypothetical protein [Sagittula sp. S175]|uniref:hypothetical protein n=1 Tax=Sagittula sp. S175 TaxID=3415129 RepID=UPI003C7E4774